MNAVYLVPVNRLRGLLACSTLWLFLCVTTVSSGALGQVPAAENLQSESRFSKTARYLDSAAPQLRSEFAATALTHLIDGYLEEVRLARQEARSVGAPVSLGGWSMAVNRYASQIVFLLKDIELGLPVRLTVAEETALSIAVGDRVFILSHPRLNQQHLLEQEILMDFCASRRCEKFSPPGTEPASMIATSIYIRPEWAFTIRGPVCSYQGIAVHFSSRKNLAKSRLICEQFLQEVILLTNEISWQRGLAVPIDWGEVEIQPTSRRAEHTVRLNRLGDAVIVTTPLLYGNPRLLGHILPWIRQWLTNPQDASIALNADHYGWIEP